MKSDKKISAKSCIPHMVEPTLTCVKIIKLKLALKLQLAS